MGSVGGSGLIAMFLSFDLTKLRNHMVYLRQELELSKLLLEQLDQEKHLQLEIGGEVSALCLQHIRYAQELEARIRSRKALLENVIELLADAEGRMGEKVSDGLELLGLGSIGTGFC